MKAQFRTILVLIGSLAMVLAGCGGGGSTGPAAAKMLTGVAATGAPVVGTVLLKDSSPSPMQLTTTTASDGSFAFNTAGLTPPFLIKTSAAGSNLYSMAADAGISNLTPLTTLALALATDGADLDALFSNHVQSEISAAAARMPDAVTAVHKSLAPLMEQFGVTGNLLTGPFSANHTGLDALLDAVSIGVSKGMISISSKQNGAVLFSAPWSALAASKVGGMAPTLPPASAAASGNALYIAQCAGCHGAAANSTLRGQAKVAAIQAAIAANKGGMGMLNGLSAADLQAISDLLMAAGGSITVPASPTSPPVVPPVVPSAPDGAALYAAKCAACHGALAASNKLGATTVRLQNAISGNVGGMSLLASLSAAEMQAIAAALNASGSTPPATPPVTAPVTPPTTPPTTTAPPGTAVADGVALYAANCSGCHGALAVSSKQGITIARLQNAIANRTGGMGTLSSLSVTEVQAIVTALTPATPTPTPSVPTPPTPSSTAPVCGSCHAIPPATGRHSKHRSEGIACATCHGSDYSNTTVSAATHNNGVKNLAGSIGWNAASRSCANACHRAQSW